MLRIGVWFDSAHCSYGGPTLVLLGGIIGLIQDAEASQTPISILINEPGDVNWIVSHIPDYETVVKSLGNPLIGPMTFSHSDALCKEYTTHDLWKAGNKFIIASEWFKNLISIGLPFNDKEKVQTRSLTVWGSGVNTDFYIPSDKKTQDYFVYFKSQKYADLKTLNVFLFNNFFKMSGSTLIYYHYDINTLKETAQKSRFCIFLSATETQCLAALEIMACDIPLFVIDTPTYTIEDIEAEATSVTCWDERCGMKTTIDKIETDFLLFYKMMEQGTYKPREFVLEKYSFKAAAHELRKLL